MCFTILHVSDETENIKNVSFPQGLFGNYLGRSYAVYARILWNHESQIIELAFIRPKTIKTLDVSAIYTKIVVRNSSLY